MKLPFPEKATGLTLIVVGMAWFLFSCTRPSAPPLLEASSPVQPLMSRAALQPDADVAISKASCKVLTVYDGDTIGCDLNGDGKVQRPAEEIRLLGIDSPEMHYSRKNPTYRTASPTDEAFAPESSRWMTQQTLNKTVYLEFDKRRYDRYDRTLAYVYRLPQERVSVNEDALAQGYARLLILGKNRRYQARFEEAEMAARQLKKGLWKVSAASH